MKRVLSCLLAAILILCLAPSVLAAPSESPELAERLYGGSTDEVTDPGLAGFLDGYEGNELTYAVRGNSLYVQHFDVDMTVTSMRTVSVVETIDVMFNEEAHGYYRTIPTYGSEEMYRITNIRATGAESLIETSADEVSVRMGSEDFTVEGLMTYVISYDIEYFNDITADGDRIYQNVFPGDLEDYVLNATARITMPESVELMDYRVYSGSYGSTSSNMEVYVHDGVMYLYSKDRFRPGEGATIELLFPEGTFSTRPADITVTDAQYELTVEPDGTFLFTQYLTADVQADTSYPMLPVWLNLGQTGKMDDRDPGTSHVRTAVAVDGSTVHTALSFEPDCLVNLGKYKGQSVSVKAVQKGRFDVEDIPYELLGTIQPIQYYPGCMIEYDSVTFVAHLPAADGEAFSCGSYAFTGSNSSEYYFDIRDTEDGFIATLNGTLPVGESVEIGFSLPEGAVERKAAWTDWAACIAPIALLIAVIIIRSRPKKALVTTMEYYPPDNLNPAEVGYIIDGTVDAKDLTSLVYYWASHGHLAIEMTTKTRYTLHKLTDLDSDHMDYEQIMFKSLWSLGSKDAVTSSQLDEKYYPTLMRATTKLKAHFSKPEKRLTDAKAEAAFNILGLVALGFAILFPLITSVAAPTSSGHEVFGAVMALLFFLPSFSLMRAKGGTIYEKKSFIVRALLNACAAVLSVIGAGLYASMLISVAVGIFPGLLLAAALPVIICLIPGIRTRSEYGNYIIGRCQGFKQFLKTAEKDRLEMLLEENPDYYYNILPYAQVLGVSNIWTDKFKGLSTQPPTWFYGTDVDSATIHYMMMRNMTRMNTNMRSMPASSSSGNSFGGFSGGGGGFGGGFSGGGGGGGGGGGW